ncbi:polysaccharide biosynthesis/export family protein [Desulfobaculum bizertense]|uniref:Protein involved in polysaccharide export, contains SLBB domain of the beta-grasp fold n=1 Tax=Desulfobaculum bizertense DSM 18034 TaxID=1121442 RepID=A0A1T4VYU6_9BACT|nr:polysaccharide biosynthesis/export family protein [Desulfobaculum bizertense]SKA70190.1 protein involved in polysaccharide export, contains SLBB domain of the beta-grasp fold [Desulfobaculum bizertense DSM 18034]
MRILLITCLVFFSMACQATALEVSVGESLSTTSEENTNATETILSKDSQVFGASIFDGSFSKTTLPSYNPHYIISIGDTVSLRLWGYIELQQEAIVDIHGNIFIPKIGTVNVAGLPNNKLNTVVKNLVRKKYKDNVFVYAFINKSQPVSVFVTGNVKKPGLYQGMSSDSIVQYLDKAAGINPHSGSFRVINVLRNGQVIHSFDLYHFLVSGEVDQFQFRNGDSINVTNKKNSISVSGKVNVPGDFEFTAELIPANTLLQLAQASIKSTGINISDWKTNGKTTINFIPRKEWNHTFIHAGSSVEVVADYQDTKLKLCISGEHTGKNTLILPRDATLNEAFKEIQFTKFSASKSVQIFRKSIAAKQKELLDAKLSELESLVLTSGAATKDEALLRKNETESILEFIRRARQIEPRGLVILPESTNKKSFVLEKEDTLYVPRKSSLVLVNGEVAFPGAHLWNQDKSIKDYLNQSGGLGQRANEEYILLIHPNGSVERCDSSYKRRNMLVSPGDSILVMPQIEVKHLQIARDVTQILYQIAVATGVLLAI